MAGRKKRRLGPLHRCFADRHDFLCLAKIVSRGSEHTVSLSSSWGSGYLAGPAIPIAPLHLG